MPGTVKGRWIVCNVTRFRETPATTDRLMFERHELDDEMTRKQVPIRVEQEGGASGKRDVDGMRRGVFLGLDFDGKSPDGNKAERAKPFSRAAQAGNVDLVEAAWNQDYLDEHELFPDGLHDDQVDASSGAMKFLRERMALGGMSAETIPKGEEAPTWGSI
jgi:predicted phage terminase large subunit-like protein